MTTASSRHAREKIQRRIRPDFFRLVDVHAGFERDRFDGRRGNLLPAPARPIGLRDHGFDGEIGSESSRRREGTANSGVPQKMMRRDMASSARGYQVPAFCSLRIRRRIRSRFSMLRYWMNRMPLRWSISWQKARASRPSPFISYGLARGVLRAHGDVLRPRHIAAEARQGQAALFFPLLALGLDDLGIGQDHARFRILAHGDVDHRQAQPEPNLRRGQPHAVRRVHGSEHVVAQLGQLLVEFLDRLGPGFQHRSAVLGDRIDLRSRSGVVAGCGSAPAAAADVRFRTRRVVFGSHRSCGASPRANRRQISPEMLRPAPAQPWPRRPLRRREPRRRRSARRPPARPVW